MNQLAVKLGDLLFLTKSEISSTQTFVSQKAGGPDRDRTDDLLHAMQSFFYSIFDDLNFYLFNITSKCITYSLPIGMLIPAHNGGRLQTKGWVAGGKIGGLPGGNSIRFCFVHNRSADLFLIIPSATSFANLMNHIKTTSRHGFGGSYEMVQALFG